MAGTSGTLTRSLVATFSAFKALQNPKRADAVATLGETTGREALRRLRDGMRRDPDGRRLLAERPVVSTQTVDVATLRALPPDTFGFAYADFMRSHAFDPDARDDVRFVDDPELAFVMQRYRQVHDFGHVLCGLPPTVCGELALKWFELVQTKLPLCALSAVVGPLALPPAERDVLRRVYVPWAVSAGARARPLLHVRYEDEFATPLAQLRERLLLTPAPVPALGDGPQQPGTGV